MPLAVHKIHVRFASVQKYFTIELSNGSPSVFYTGNIKWQQVINLTGTEVMTSLMYSIWALILEFGIVLMRHFILTKSQQ